jgi:DDE superfamily endonuclease
MWCVAEIDEQYVARMEDVLELYERPYHPQEPVVCFDEKAVTLHAEVRPPQTVRPGKIAKRDSEYKRRGTANTFCAVEPKAGRHFTWVSRRRTAVEFAQSIRKLVESYPLARTIHVVLDNLNIHCRKSLTDQWGDELGASLWRRLTVHHTPKHGSWLNQAEIEIGLYSRQCLGNRRIPDISQLKLESTAWNRRVNRDRLLIQWNFNRQDAQRVFHYQSNLFSRSEN